MSAYKKVKTLIFLALVDMKVHSQGENKAAKRFVEWNKISLYVENPRINEYKIYYDYIRRKLFFGKQIDVE